MAQIIWTEPALLDLNEIAEYIAIDKPSAAIRLVQKVFPVLYSTPHCPDQFL